ncbi:MAG: hypothetical protein KF889_26000 [Alphaproteobacteria bacterium]|nr:hypothetical protein [Alphaproteobacteria bacterium]MCW5739551.1 hypothetical protein [Alphaproteobacteria bacterium]
MRFARPTILVLLMLTGAPAAWADGFSRFQDLLVAKGKVDMFRFASGSSLGPNGFVLENVVVTPPPDMVEPGNIPVKPVPTRIARVSVEEIDFNSIARDRPPLFVRARFEGIALDGEAAPEGAMRKYLGTDSARADIAIAYRLDPASRVFELAQLEIDLRGLARLALAITVDGVAPDVTDAPGRAAGAASLRSASLVIHDASLMARLIRALAAEEGVPPERHAETLAQAVMMMLGGEGPVTQAAARTVAAFLRDWQSTQGPLSITLNPQRPVTFADLGAIAQAEEAMKALGLVVTYAGTTVTAPPPPPAGARLTGRAAIERLIGNTTTATIDGSEVVDYFAPDGTYVSQVDADIDRGRWRIDEENQLCLKLRDEEENCFKVEVSGRKVTYIHDVDDQEEFDLHDGNVRNL